MQMETSIKDSGKRTKPMELGSTSAWMELYIMGIELMTSRKAKEQTPGQMVLSIRDLI